MRVSFRDTVYPVPVLSYLYHNATNKRIRKRREKGSRKEKTRNKKEAKGKKRNEEQPTILVSCFPPAGLPPSTGISGSVLFLLVHALHVVAAARYKQTLKQALLAVRCTLYVVRCNQCPATRNPQTARSQPATRLQPATCNP